MLEFDEIYFQDKQQTMELLTDKASDGDLNCIKLLANLLYSNDCEQSIEWYQMAATMGDVDSLLFLAEYYAENFHASEEDLSKSVGYLEKAATLNDSRAIIKLSRYYQTLDFNSIHYEIINRASELGCSASTNYIANMKQGQSKLDYLLNAAENGNTESQFQACKLLFNGDIGIERDEFRAVELVINSATTYTNPNIVQLGKWYMTNECKQLDCNRAFDCFLKASIQGDLDSLVMLGDCYYYGHGCEIDLDLAKEYYQKAIDNGHTEAILSIIKCLKPSDPLCKQLFRQYIEKTRDLVPDEQEWNECIDSSFI